MADFQETSHQTLRLGLVGIAVALALVYNIFQVLRNPNSRLPGPWYSKWTSIVLTYHWLKGNRAYYVHDLHIKYGPVVRVSPDEVEVADAAAAKTIYSHRETFVKAPFYLRVTAVPEHNIFNTPNVDIHRRMRRLMAGPMSESSLKSVEPTVVSHIDFAIRRMKEEMGKRGATDVWTWWTYMATDIIGALTFGESFRTLDIGKPTAYTQDLKSLAPLAAIRSTFPSLIPLTKVLPLPILQTAREASKRMIRYSEESLSRYKNMLDADPTRAQTTLLTKVFQAKEDDKMTFNELRNTANAYIVAGTDTTANTLTYLTWLVCRNPEIKATLLEELCGLPEDFSDEHLKALPYLSQVIEEALRLYPAVPGGLPRSVPAEGAEVAGYTLPGGTTVCTQAYTMHRNPEAFPEPERFNPSRWADTTTEMKDSFMAFGRGARVCLGLHLAYMELRRGAACFFREFPEAKVSTMDGMCDEGMKPKIYFLINPSGKQCLVEGQ